MATSNFDNLFNEFSEKYGSNDYDFEGTDLADYVVAAGYFLADIVGEQAATKAMAALVRAVGFECKVDEDWEQSLMNYDIFTEWPMGTLFLF